MTTFDNYAIVIDKETKPEVALYHNTVTKNG